MNLQFTDLVAEDSVSLEDAGERIVGHFAGVRDAFDGARRDGGALALR